MTNLMMVIPRRLTAIALLPIFMLTTTECTYYKVQNDQKTPVPKLVEKAVATSGSTSGIEKIREGWDVVVAMKKGNVVTGDFRYYDSAFVYLGPHNPPKAIRKSDIKYIKPSSHSKYLIIHGDYQTWHLKYAVLSDDKTALRGEVENVGPDHQFYLKSKPGNTNRYKTKEGDPTQEIHLYATGVVPDSSSSVVVPLSSITRVEIYNGANDASTAIAAIFIGAVGYALFLGILSDQYSRN